MKKLLSALFCIVIASPAMASFVFSPGLSYMTSDTEATQGITSNSETGETRIDLKFGYVLPMGLYLGGMYSSLNLKSGGNSSSGSYIGPTIGYYSMMGFYTLLTYHIIGDVELSPGVDLSGGKGPQIDVGWVFPLTAYFAIGPQITWRSAEFDKVDTGAGDVDTDFKRTTIAPYLSLWFMF